MLVGSIMFIFAIAVGLIEIVGRRIRKSKALKEAADRAAQEARRREARLQQILSYPILQLSQEDFETLSAASRELTQDDLEAAPIGTRFLCRKKEESDPPVVGVLVAGDDLFGCQYGAGLSVPKKGINRYRVEIQ